MLDMELDARRRRTRSTVSVERSRLSAQQAVVTPLRRPPVGRAADAAVIERSWTEPEAFAELFERHADDIHRYAARRLGAAVADDLLAETFVIAFQHRGRYDVARPDARPWLYGIATNLVGAHRRAEARRLRAMSRALRSDDDEPMADRIDARVSAQSARGALAGALAGLPARHRDVVLLLAWAELDYQQIADALGVPLGTVRSRLHRARNELQAAIAANKPTGDGGCDDG
jgi:RNA polymerase sigma-70 factor (ECF subfamily)